MSSSLIWRHIHSALCHIEAKSFVNYLFNSSLGRPCLTQARIWPSAGLLTQHFLWPQGASPPGFYPLREVGLLPETPLIRGMPMEPKVFLAMPDACGLPPCARAHLKKGLCYTCPVVGRRTNTCVNSSLGRPCLIQARIKPSAGLLT